MLTKYTCSHCKTIFEAEGNKKEWTNPIYGPCMKYVALCPDCQAECDEYRVPQQSKISSAIPQSSCNGCCSGCSYAK